jgi:hypothetical protein
MHVGPCHQFLSELDVAPCPVRFGTFLGRSSEFVIFSGLVPGLLGVKFASLHDLYGASRPYHKVLDELILEVLLSTSKPCINTKLQNRHARMTCYIKGVSTNGQDIKLMPTPKVNSWLGSRNYTVNGPLRESLDTWFILLTLVYGIIRALLSIYLATPTRTMPVAK